LTTPHQPSTAANPPTGWSRPGPLAGGQPEDLHATEWLLTNGTGGFSMGTALGAMSRRYHGLLVAPLRPPVQRIMTLSAMAEAIALSPDTPQETRCDVTTFKFRPGVFHPRGDVNLERFEKDTSARWHYRVGPARLTKQVHLFRGAPSVAIRYTLDTAGQAARVWLRPLVALRDFHALVLRDTSRGRYHVETGEHGCVVRSAAGTLHLAAPGARVEREEQWWYDFQYDLERERGYDFLEDLYQPCLMVWDVPAGPGPKTLTVHASTQAFTGPLRDIDADADHRRSRLDAIAKAAATIAKAPALPAPARTLVAAADDFIVRRAALPDGPAIGQGDRVSVIAGYPWFADWGRDSMISLPGLLLTTGRFDEARDVLLTFASHRSQGLVPNVFDDYTGQAHHNTVDASLWFVHAAGLYFRASADAVTFKNDLLPACLDIIAHYRQGTMFAIGADPADGLIRAGDQGTQLTWMDAKRDGVTFTPRHGKAVEINALWHNALAWMAELGVGLPNAAELAALRDRVAESFRAAFWNAQASCLFDTLAPEHGQWRPVAEGRPNQILAVSLPYSPLTPAQQRAVLGFCRSRLLTPRAVRTLDPGDQRYQGRYRGNLFQRDSAYHNGTAWPWLLGPLAEATLRVGNFSDHARQEARDMLAPIIAQLDTDCPGQLPEVFDGDDTPGQPQRPGGCPAQAWSVAEVLRVLMMIERGQA
jgi:predicted glycogen debranching enzyme